MSEPHLEWVATSRCVMLRRNPQYLTPRQMGAMKRSVQRDGFLAPILVRPIEAERYEIVSGNHRFLAAKELGLDTVPALIVAMSDRQAQRVAVNLNTIHGDPTAELLAPFLAELDDITLAEIHLSEPMLRDLAAFDTTLLERFATLDAPPVVDRSSPATPIAPCQCPRCGKTHIAAQPADGL